MTEYKTALHFYRSVPSTVPSRILLCVIHLFLKSFSGQTKQSLFLGTKPKQTMLRQLAGQAGHSPGSLWGCPSVSMPGRCLWGGEHTSCSQPWLKPGTSGISGDNPRAFLGPAPLAVLCHPTACTESVGQPQPRHWALDHRAMQWQFLKDCKTYNSTYAAIDRS